VVKENRAKAKGVKRVKDLKENYRLHAVTGSQGETGKQKTEKHKVRENMVGCVQRPHHTSFVVHYRHPSNREL
jgi:hypothetical protein